MSDWSSDVCSSDLRGGGRPADRRASADRRYHQLADRLARRHPRDRLAALRQRKGLGDARRDPALAPQIEQVRDMALVGRRIARGERPPEHAAHVDRKSGGEGQSVAVRVGLGGGGFIKKKKKQSK